MGRNKKGWLTKEELVDAMTAMDFTQPEIISIWNKIDSAHTGKITYPMFSSGFAHLLRGPAPKDEAGNAVIGGGDGTASTSTNTTTGTASVRSKSPLPSSSSADTATTSTDASGTPADGGGAAGGAAAAEEAAEEAVANKLASKVPQAVDTAKMALDLFQVLDEDGNGQLERDELMNTMLDIDPSFTQDQLSDAFEKLDEGKKGYITCQEFCDGFSLFSRNRLRTFSNVDEEEENKKTADASDGAVPPTPTSALVSTEVTEDLESDLRKKTEAIQLLERQLSIARHAQLKHAKTLAIIQADQSKTETENVKLKEAAAGYEKDLRHVKREALESATALEQHRLMVEQLEEQKRKYEDELQRARRMEKEREELLEHERQRTAKMEEERNALQESLSNLKTQKNKEERAARRLKLSSAILANNKLKIMEAKLSEMTALEEKYNALQNDVLNAGKESFENQRLVQDLQNTIAILRQTLTAIDPALAATLPVSTGGSDNAAAVVNTPQHGSGRRLSLAGTLAPTNTAMTGVAPSSSSSSTSITTPVPFSRATLGPRHSLADLMSGVENDNSSSSSSTSSSTSASTPTSMTGGVVKKGDMGTLKRGLSSSAAASTTVITPAIAVTSASAASASTHSAVAGTLSAALAIATTAQSIIAPVTGSINSSNNSNSPNKLVASGNASASSTSNATTVNTGRVSPSTAVVVSSGTSTTPTKSGTLTGAVPASGGTDSSTTSSSSSPSSSSLTVVPPINRTPSSIDKPPNWLRSASKMGVIADAAVERAVAKGQIAPHTATAGFASLTNRSESPIGGRTTPNSLKGTSLRSSSPTTAATSGTGSDTSALVMEGVNGKLPAGGKSSSPSSSTIVFTEADRLAAREYLNGPKSGLKLTGPITDVQIDRMLRAGGGSVSALIATVESSLPLETRRSITQPEDLITALEKVSGGVGVVYSEADRLEVRHYLDDPSNKAGIKLSTANITDTQIDRMLTAGGRSVPAFIGSIESLPAESRKKVTTADELITALQQNNSANRVFSEAERLATREFLNGPKSGLKLNGTITDPQIDRMLRAGGGSVKTLMSSVESIPVESRSKITNAEDLIAVLHDHSSGVVVEGDVSKKSDRVRASMSKKKQTYATLSGMSSAEREKLRRELKNELLDISKLVYTATQSKAAEESALKAKGKGGTLTEEEKAAIEEAASKKTDELLSGGKNKLGLSSAVPPPHLSSSSSSSTSTTTSSIAGTATTAMIAGGSSTTVVLGEDGRSSVVLAAQNDESLRRLLEELQRTHALRLKEEEEKRKREAEEAARKLKEMSDANDELNKRLAAEAAERNRLEMESQWRERQLKLLEDERRKACIIL